ncbi:hypothetical protein L798_10688 [Zootermopsis nevadensis]|uniref:Uncharacterized protein n=1 Tax=Zootermopsis nevadensis TaxID=136037 RepID=A0A067R953_ZOONE|nr:hypothetical protein L798_10688 [Zootermopsis nevadensis]
MSHPSEPFTQNKKKAEHVTLFKGSGVIAGLGSMLVREIER